MWIAELELNALCELPGADRCREEFVYVFDGTVERTVLEEVMVLSPRDAVRGTTAHEFRPGAGRPATLLTVQSSGGSGVSAVEMDGADRG